MLLAKSTINCLREIYGKKNVLSMFLSISLISLTTTLIICLSIQGCGKPGEYVYLPYSFISSQNTSHQQERQSTAGQLIANQWARLRYGVFADLQEHS